MFKTHKNRSVCSFLVILFIFMRSLCVKLIVRFDRVHLEKSDISWDAKNFYKKIERKQQFCCVLFFRLNFVARIRFGYLSSLSQIIIHLYEFHLSHVQIECRKIWKILDEWSHWKPLCQVDKCEWVSECIYFACQKRIDLTCKILFDISNKYLIQINMFGEAMLMPDGVPAAAAAAVLWILFVNKKDLAWARLTFQQCYHSISRYILIFSVRIPFTNFIPDFV